MGLELAAVRIAGQDPVPADGYHTVIRSQGLRRPVSVCLGHILCGGGEMMLRHFIVHAVAAGDGIPHKLDEPGLGLCRVNALLGIHRDLLDGNGGHGAFRQLHDPYRNLLCRIALEHGIGLFRLIDLVIHHPFLIHIHRTTGIVRLVIRSFGNLIPRGSTASSEGA